MAAAAGVEPRGEDEDEFERLSALLYESAEVSDYLLARMNAQRLAAAVMEQGTTSRRTSGTFKGGGQVRRKREYDHETLRDEREYGFYRQHRNILRPELTSAACRSSFGLISGAYSAIDEHFLGPSVPRTQTNTPSPSRAATASPAWPTTSRSRG